MNAKLKATIQHAWKTIDHRIDQVNRNSLNCVYFKPKERQTMSDCPQGRLVNITISHDDNTRSYLKDGAYYCYCAYVLRITRYSDFLSPMFTNTGMYLSVLKLSGESRS